MQATDLKGRDRNNVLRTLEPGDQLYYGKAAAPGSKSLPKEHGDHGGEKKPSSWVWQPMELPRYPQAGRKVVRIMTKSKGFTFAYAVVSARKYLEAPPRSLDEVKKQAKKSR
jgi:hypothetical protein